METLQTSPILKSENLIMQNYINEILVILLGAGGVISTILAWKFGGKQKAKNSKDDTLTIGAASVVKTAMDLLDRINGLLDEESRHRKSCEEKLAEVSERVHQLEKLLNNE